MDRIFEWLIKFLFVAMLAPFLASIACTLFLGLAWALLPWLIAFGVIVGVSAGVSSALMHRRRLPVHTGRRPIAGDPIRRPRGPRGHES